MNIIERMPIVVSIQGLVVGIIRVITKGDEYLPNRLLTKKAISWLELGSDFQKEI